MVSLAILGSGVLFAAFGVTTLAKDSRVRREWQPRRGRVVATRLSDGRFRCLVAYQHEGQEVRFWNRYTSTGLVDPVGREVEVLVDPEDPHDAVVGRGQVGGRVVGGAFLAFGILAVVVGAALRTW